MIRPLSLLVHGESGVGKSWLGDSAPYPKLTLAAEGGAQWTPSAKRIWDPVREEPPVADGTWETAVVYVRDFNDINRAYQWLYSGRHQFASVIMDSVTVVQKRARTGISGRSAPTQQAYGQLLIDMEATIQEFVDLTVHPANPLQTLVLITTTRPSEQGFYRPNVIGGLAFSLPYMVDVIGYLYAGQNEAGNLTRYLLIQPAEGFLAKDRTHVLSGRLGSVIEDPNVQKMMEVING